MERRGRLIVYLGSAPGVGKTYAALGEAHRRLARGTDVVVGFVETHDRRADRGAGRGARGGAPRGRSSYRGATFTEMDVDAVLARRPAVVVRRRARAHQRARQPAREAGQDVEELLAAGIDVITTVNIQHLESLNDEVERITGVRQRETVPDEVVRAADQIQLVDMSPEALRRRMAHGNIYRPEQIDASLDVVLPGRQPHRAARAGPAVAGRPGRRPARRLPPGAPDPGAVAGQGADRRRGHRRPGERDADPARRAARRSGRPAPSCWPCT